MTQPTTNRSMFRRLIRRLLFANRGRLFVILLALSVGAAVSAASSISKPTPNAGSHRNFAPLAPSNHSSENHFTFCSGDPSRIYRAGDTINLPTGPVSVSSTLYVVANVADSQSGSLFLELLLGPSHLSFSWPGHFRLEQTRSISPKQ